MVRYCNAPTRDLYKVGSEKGLLAAVNEAPGASGVDTGFESNILARIKIFGNYYNYGKFRSLFLTKEN